MNTLKDKMTVLAGKLRGLGGDECIEAAQLILSATASDAPDYAGSIDRATGLLVSAVSDGNCNLLGSNKVSALLDSLKAQITAGDVGQTA